MPILKASDSAGVPDLDFGAHPAVVDEVKVTTGKDFKDPTKEVPRLEIAFRLPDDDDVIVRQWATLYDTLTPKQTLYPIVSALLYAGAEIPKDDEIDTDEMVGKPCQIIWGTYTKGDKTQGTGITQVLPPRRKGSSGNNGSMSQARRSQAQAEIDAV